MELWIRSQDRENTVKINRQYGLHWKDKTMIIADYQPDFVGTEGEYYELLGKYESKKRALEVLDEIQNILKPQKVLLKVGKPIAETCDGTIYREPDEYDIKEPSIYVYEMPKE